MPAFNEYLKTLRERKFLDIGTVAERTGVHRNTQSKYEDSRDPPFDYLVEFSALVDEPFINVLLKRLDDSKASPNAIVRALDSLKPTPVAHNQSQLSDENHTDKLQVQLSEESHTLIPAGALVSIDTSNKTIDADSIYGFLNPMNGGYFAAKLKLTNSKLHLLFDHPTRKDLSFAIEGGETESHYILKTLGLLGKVVKAELSF